MATTSDTKETFNWLYPDLLAKDELLRILSNRYIKVKDLELLSKDELVELYNEYVLPLPQRKHRLNRRGRDMTKKQIIRAKKRKSILSPDSLTIEGQPAAKRNSTCQLQNHISPSSSGDRLKPPPGGDRLKPPPSCVNFEKKTVKLNSASKAQGVSPVSSSLNQLKLNIKSATDKTDCDDGERKKIKLKHTTDNDSKDVKDKSDEGKKVEASSDEPTPMDTSEKSDDPSPTTKTKIKKIAWP